VYLEGDNMAADDRILLPEPFTGKLGRTQKNFGGDWSLI